MLSDTANYISTNDLITGSDGNIWFTSNGQIVNLEGMTKISVDFYNIACGTYNLTVYSQTTGKTTKSVTLDIPCN